MNLLSQITKSSLSIVRLIEHGFDQQGKVLLRSLMELINLTILITAKKDSMINYCKGIDDEKANNVWKNNFKTWQVNNQLSEIEKNLSIKENTEIIRKVKEIRKKTYRYFSNAVHSSYHSTILSNYAILPSSVGNIDDIMHFSLFGKYTHASLYSLQDLNWLIFYLIVLLQTILKKVHNFEMPIKDDVMWNIHQVLAQAYLASLVYGKFIEE
ncbi:hypothetical protein [Peribacillus frigoritolerans]|uniref:hypothetical protein n=1 Tax=Peribacillus frigoritolerans TaxID=450367 RepID=UPI002E2515D4|nr:hypothetical protein [Peribacillus frigoritolerans]